MGKRHDRKGREAYEASAGLGIVLAGAKERIGSTARERLNWLVNEIVYREDLGDGDKELFESLRFDLNVLIVEATGGTWAFKISRSFRDELLEAEETLRDALTSFVAHRIYKYELYDDVEIEATQTEPASAYAVRPSVSLQFRASLPDVLLVAMFSLIREIPLRLLRRCPYRTNRRAAECGQVFVARKRQKWCIGHQATVRYEQDQAALRTYRAKMRKRKRQEQRPGKAPSGARTRKEGRADD